MPRFQSKIYPASSVPSDDISTRIMLCILLVAGTAGLFWVYDASMHREAPFVPSVGNSSPGRGLYTGLVAAAPRISSGTHAVGESSTSSAAVVEPNKLDTPRANIAKVLRSISPAAANAYASGENYYRREIGAPD